MLDALSICGGNTKDSFGSGQRKANANQSDVIEKFDRLSHIF